MSHIVHQQTQMIRPEGITRACKKLGLKQPEKGEFDFSRNIAKGLLVDLSPIDADWIKPIVIQADGTIAYDNYGGRWGSEATLDKLIQRYAVEVARIEAERQGYTATESVLQDGSILLDVYCN